MSRTNGIEAADATLVADVIIDADRIATDTQRGAGRDLSKADAEKALDGVITATTEGLNKGEIVSLIGFGSFSTSKRSARTGHNPQTGEENYLRWLRKCKEKAPPFRAVSYP